MAGGPCVWAARPEDGPAEGTGAPDTQTPEAAGMLPAGSERHSKTEGSS